MYTNGWETDPQKFTVLQVRAWFTCGVLVGMVLVIRSNIGVDGSILDNFPMETPAKLNFGGQVRNLVSTRHIAGRHEKSGGRSIRRISNGWSLEIVIWWADEGLRSQQQSHRVGPKFQRGLCYLRLLNGW